MVDYKIFNVRTGGYQGDAFLQGLGGQMVRSVESGEANKHKNGA